MRKGFIDVDQLMPQITLEQAATFYGVPLPELHKVGSETRTQCFLNCGCCEQTGERALAIKVDHPAKQWRCHQYGCGRGGNLVSLCDLLKPGQHMDGRPRGERFKEIAQDLAEMAAGVPGSISEPAPPKKQPALEREEFNLPLKDSPNEKARDLTELDEKFVVDPAEMNPKAAAYFRKRPFVTPEVCKKWRMGYLPRNTGEDKRGGTMRGKIVYGLKDERGDVLTWFGRDPEFEEKHRKWLSGGKQGKEPSKVHFVRGFHRGLELFGQHEFANATNPVSESGIMIVEGPNDVIRLDTLGVSALGLMSNTITDSQVERIGDLAFKCSSGGVTLMLDCDEEGQRGAKEAIWKLAQSGLSVQLAWSRSVFDGRFRDRQPESLTEDDWNEISSHLR